METKIYDDAEMTDEELDAMTEEEYYGWRIARGKADYGIYNPDPAPVRE